MDVAALAADVTERPTLSEPFQTKEARARVVHRKSAFIELRSTAVVAFQLTIIDSDCLRLISHCLPPVPFVDSSLYDFALGH